MQAFLVGLVFLVAFFVLTCVGILLLPFLVLLTFFLRILASIAFVIFGIWLLGKLVIWVWEQMNQ